MKCLTKSKKIKPPNQFLVFLHQLWDPSTAPSNIPMVTRISQMAIRVCPFSFTFSKNFQLCTTPRQFCLQCLALSNVFLHLVVILDRLLRHVTSPNKNPLDNWKLIMLGYFLVVFGGVAICLLHVIWVRHDLVFLLNSCIQIERNCKEKGKKLKLLGRIKRFIILTIFKKTPSNEKVMFTATFSRLEISWRSHS